MISETALWRPFWHGLDQSLAVDQVGDFDFLVVPAQPQGEATRSIFFCGDWTNKELYYSAKKRILSIHHAVLGLLKGIETGKLTYAFILSDGTKVWVDAEQNPGSIDGISDGSARERITDWSCVVTMERVR